MVTNQQLYLAIGLPILLNSVVIGMAVSDFNSRIADLKAHFDTRIDDLRNL